MLTWRRAVGAALALILVAAVLVVARPDAVWTLLRTSQPQLLSAAFAVAGLTLILRGLRLKLLLPPEQLPAVEAPIIAAAAQSAALFVPARLGELALPWLLKRRARWDATAGVGTLLVARALDLAGLGLWAGLSIIGVFGATRPLTLLAAGSLILPALLLPVMVKAADHTAQTYFGSRGPRAQTAARHIHDLSESIAELRRRPGRFLAAAACTVAMWASVWAMTWLQLAAMGHRWSPATVVAGSAAASVANILPLNLIGNLGTLEAGWTAAFTALGVPLEQAAATGLAAHLWALVFYAVFGFFGWVVIMAMGKLSASGDGRDPQP